MSQFTSGFWDLYVGVITVVSILACAVLLWTQSTHKSSASETSGHVWDEDLKEYNNALPRWWMWMFYLTIVFALGYLVLYPGLGSYAGTLGWTQAKQFEDETKAAEAAFGPLYEGWAKQDLAALAKDEKAMKTGQKLFLNNCAQCHASDGGGSRGFPNLADKDWLWGGTPEAIKTSIAEGRIGNMPALGSVLNEEASRDVAHYVLSLSGEASDALRVSKGEQAFKTVCAACHGADGKGNPALGAPNLTDKVWLHGGGVDAIMERISKGKVNQMPAHKDILTPAKIHLLTAYVMSLSQPPK